MKKITFTVIALLVGSFVFSQSTTLEGTVSQPGFNFEGNQSTVSDITLISEVRGIVEVFTSRTDLEDACSGLTLEDFANGPGVVLACGPVIDSSGGACYAPGEIEEGIAITFAGSGTDTVYVPAGGFGNANDCVGSNTFVDFTVINFDAGINAVGFDSVPLLGGNPVEVRIFGTGGFIAAYTVSGIDTFFGVLADEDIVSIEIEDLSGVDAELVSMMVFGFCEVVSSEDFLLQNVSIYPNPVSDVLTINLTNGVEVVNVNVYDVLGKNTGVSLVNGQLNVAGLQKGVYLISIETNKGVITQKIVKK